jgi:tetratricopeptide (TPR) repeat protein
MNRVTRTIAAVVIMFAVLRDRAPQFIVLILGGSIVIFFATMIGVGWYQESSVDAKQDQLYQAGRSALYQQDYASAIARFDEALDAGLHRNSQMLKAATLLILNLDEQALSVSKGNRISEIFLQGNPVKNILDSTIAGKEKVTPEEFAYVNKLKLQIANEVLETEPDLKELWIKRGMLHLDRVKLLSYIPDSGPQQWAVNNRLALESFDKALSIDPSYSAALTLRNELCKLESLC